MHKCCNKTFLSHIEVDLSGIDIDREKEVCGFVICLLKGMFVTMEPFKRNDASWFCDVHYTSTITHVYFLFAIFLPGQSAHK